MLSLTGGLNKRNHHVTVALPENLTQSIESFQLTDSRVVPLAIRKLAWPPDTIVALFRLVRNGGFDIIHIHSQEAGLLGRLVAWLAGAPAILYTPQTLDIRRARWHVLYRLIERLLARITSAVISVNESDRRRLIHWGIPPRKITTIYNGIDLSDFEDPVDVGALRQRLGFEAHAPLVMQVGRLSAQKDPIAFVEGAERVISLCPGTQFALVGDGPLAKEVEARVRELGLAQYVRCVGWQENAFRLIGAADLVTLTSRWEGAPYALLEAMAWSRPVVATAVNGCPEIVADGVTGFLVPPGDVTAWASRVTHLLTAPTQAESMGQQGRKRLEEQFTVQLMIAGIERLYLQLAMRPSD